MTVHPMKLGVERSFRNNDFIVTSSLLRKSLDKEDSHNGESQLDKLVDW